MLSNHLFLGTIVMDAVDLSCMRLNFSREEVLGVNQMESVVVSRKRMLAPVCSLSSATVRVS